MEAPISKKTKQPPKGKPQGNIKPFCLLVACWNPLWRVFKTVFDSNPFGLFDFDLTLVRLPFWLLWLWIYQCWAGIRKIWEPDTVPSRFSFWISHWVIPCMKPGCRVSYNLRTGPLKPWSNMYFNFIETLAGYWKKSGPGFRSSELIRVSVVNRVLVFSL